MPAKTPAKPKTRKPVRPKHLAHGRWLGDFPNLSAAELRLVACCARDVPWMPEGWDLENPVRPEKATKANTIRAEVIRFLLLGGDTLHPVHEAGVMVGGAWIEEELDFGQCRATVQLDARHCHFDARPSFMAAHLPELSLVGSLVPGMVADRIKVAGGVFLSDGFSAEGEVRLLGAEIGGDLDCDEGRFANAEGHALSADRIKVAGGVFLRDGFSAEGEVRLLGAEIGGDLDSRKGRFANAGGHALNADGIKVAGNVFLRTATIDGAISLASARIGALIDDEQCWQSGGHVLDGLHYDRITGGAPTDAARRITWLKSQRPEFLDNRNWRPQPWEQVIKVLRDMGHPGAASEIALEKQRMMRKARQIGNRQPRPHLVKRWKWLELGWIWLVNAMVRLWHHVYEVLAGFGYRPGRILLWMLGLWFGSGLYFSHAANTGLMAPTSAQIIMHRQLHGDLGRDGAHAGDCGLRHEVEAPQYWPACAALPSEYTTFNPWLYSADLILPLVDLQQDSEWSPAATFTDAMGNVQNLTEGQRARALMWFEILFGWFASLMFVAIVSRLVEKD